MENIKQLQKLAEVFDTDKIITSDEIEQVLKGILVIMNSFKKDNQTLNKETKEVVEILLDRVLTENAKLKELVNRETSDQKEDFAKQVKELKDLVFKIQTIKPIDGITPKKGEDYFTDDDKTEIVEDVLAKVKLPEYEVYSLEEKGEEIVAEINALPTDKEEYKIDAKHIKNLPESKIVGGGTKFLQYLADVNISTPTDGQVLTYDDTTRTWKNEASAGGGGAWGTITGTLSNQTDLQTALDAKANSSGALTQFIGNGNWKVWYSDGSGDVKELALGADGTFLKSNGAAVAPTFATPAGGDVSKVGTPVNNQIAVWTGDGTLEGTSDFTYDNTNLNLITGKNFQIAGATILADAAGTTTLSNIDALDATTESTIESAIDTLANLTSVQGRTITLVDAGANAVFGWDDVAGAYENLTAGEVRGAIGLATTDSPMFTAIELGHASDTTITRTGAGAIAVEGVGVALNSISLPHTASQIELGHASDTTLSRASAGVVAIEGSQITTLNTVSYSGNQTQTLSVKTRYLLSVGLYETQNMTLPSTFAVGDEIEFIINSTSNAGTVNVIPASGDNFLYVGSDGQTTSTTSNFVCSRNSSFKIVCTVANSTWEIVSIYGSGGSFGGTNISSIGYSIPLSAGDIMFTTASQTVTNKRIQPRVSSSANGNITPNLDTANYYIRTALSGTCSLGVPTGSPTTGEELLFRFKDNGTARTLSWDAIYRAVGVTIPTTTVISKTLYVRAIYNSTDAKWDVVQVNQEA